MDVRNCVRCGNIYKPIGGRRYCPECVEEDRKEFDTVRNYLKTHANATLMEIAKATGVSTAKIREYIRDGRLVVSNEDVGLQCETCGEPLKQGRLCADCIQRMKNDVRRGVRSDTEREVVKPNHDLGEKDYVWNRFRRW